MKNSEKFLCVIIVLAFFALVIYLVCTFVDASNAGLHGGF